MVRDDAVVRNEPIPTSPATSSAPVTPAQAEPEPPPSASVLRLVPRLDPTLEPDELVDEDEDPPPSPRGIEILPTSSVPVPLSDVSEVDDALRDPTGIAPLDAVLGGGLVAGTIVSLTGPAGCGKSTLTMQMLAGINLRALLATGEETIKQASARARRIGAVSKKVLIVAETDIEVVLAHARETRAQLVMIDSIQTLVCPGMKSEAGSPGQVRACARRLMHFAKATETSVIVTVHMTNDDRMAGPSTLKHFVDVVLELDLGTRFEGNERILRCVGKNRIGASNVVGHFELTRDGLVPVDGDGWNEPL